ncbi:MAG: hypothetical protein A2Y17_03740 [Clostridiales bacterium GWF2_38_85]|nr:MAG: hypothetical protein A2Y17_03740 [Clostridiales bacterium GWF2_38_85]HBL85321.1 hypothetical protein [Clostridiales bacterium]
MDMGKHTFVVTDDAGNSKKITFTISTPDFMGLVKNKLYELDTFFGVENNSSLIIIGSTISVFLILLLLISKLAVRRTIRKYKKIAIQKIHVEDEVVQEQFKSQTPEEVETNV